MSLIGAFTGAIGKLFSRNQEAANTRHANNNAQRARTEENKNNAWSRVGSNIQEINRQSDSNKSVFGEMIEDIGTTAKSVGSAVIATAEDSFSDAKAALDDAAAEVEKHVKNRVGIFGTIGKAISGFFGGLFKSGVDGATSALEN